jgi:histone H3/H4
MSTKRFHVNNVKFTSYLRIILKGYHGGKIGISADAKYQISSILNFIGEDFARQANDLADSQGKKTIASKEIESSTELIIHGDLGSFAAIEGGKAVLAYNSIQRTSERMSSASKARLTIPPPRVRKFFLKYNKRIAPSSSVNLAGVLEYLASEILESSGKVAIGSGRKTITTRDIYLMVKNDLEFDRLFKDLNINIQGGGVVPNIDKAVLPVKRQTKGGKEIPIPTRKNGKNLPNVVALRNIRKIQKSSGCTHIPKSVFHRLIKEIVGEFSLDAAGVKAVQLDAEKYIVELLKDAYSCSIHAERQTLQLKDINLARKIRQEM